MIKVNQNRYRCLIHLKHQVYGNQLLRYCLGHYEVYLESKNTVCIILMISYLISLIITRVNSPGEFEKTVLCFLQFGIREVKGWLGIFFFKHQLISLHFQPRFFFFITAEGALMKLLFQRHFSFLFIFIPFKSPMSLLLFCICSGSFFCIPLFLCMWFCLAFYTRTQVTESDCPAG